MSAALITVAVPAYNAGRAIESALESALTQSLEDIEILVVNDGSQDNTKAVVERAAASDGRVVLINRAENKGVSAARETLVENARGEYIFWLDADDRMLRADALELLLQAAGADNDMVFFGELNQRIGGRAPAPPSGFPRDALIRRAIRRRTVSLRPFTRRSLLNRCVFPARNFGEDMALTIQCLVYARKIAFSPHILYHYIKNPLSICNNPRNALRNADDMTAMLEWAGAFLTERGLPDIAKTAEEEKAVSLRYSRLIRRGPIQTRPYLIEEGRRPLIKTRGRSAYREFALCCKGGSDLMAPCAFGGAMKLSRDAAGVYYTSGCCFFHGARAHPIFWTFPRRRRNTGRNAAPVTARRIRRAAGKAVSS
ncbi:MAG: glycosyltransferase [Treponema sp.]|jgi:glycosyltransferase involved in cell wall biosynthesis|nr:glycosyltransferase [Treponema sp.]